MFKGEEGPGVACCGGAVCSANQCTSPTQPPPATTAAAAECAAAGEFCGVFKGEDGPGIACCGDTVCSANLCGVDTTRTAATTTALPRSTTASTTASSTLWQLPLPTAVLSPRCGIEGGACGADGCCDPYVSCVADTCTMMGWTIFGYDLIFEGVGGDGAPRRFSTAKSSIARLFKVVGVELGSCQRKCDGLRACRGVYFWRSPTQGNFHCVGLTNLGHAAGTLTRTYGRSYAKTLTVLGVDRSIDPPLTTVVSTSTSPEPETSSPTSTPTSTPTR